MKIWDSSSKIRDGFLDELYDQYSDYLYKLAWELTPCSQDVDDLVQTVWVKIITKEQTLRSLSHPQKLLYFSKTMRNTLREDARKKKLITCSLELINDSDFDCIEDINDAIDLEIERHLFAKLWPMVKGDVREILERKYDLGESDIEIARSMGIKPESVRTYLSRARKSARIIMKQAIDSLNR